MSLLQIHKLTPHGLTCFYDFITATRLDEKKGLAPHILPAHFLTDPLFSVPFCSDKLDTKKTFSNRYEMSEYIFGTWKTYKSKYYDELGVWAWISVVYFGQLRGKQTNTHDNYIPDEFKPKGTVPTGYRHSIRYPFYLQTCTYQDEFLRFCLDRGAVDVCGDPLEMVGSNQKILTSPALMELVLKLYYDPKTGQAKSGWSSQSGPTGNTGLGGVRRLLPTIVPRVKKTFDIHDMSATELIDACGAEIKNSKWAV